MYVDLSAGNLEWFVLIPTWRTLLLTGLTWKIPVGTGESLLQSTPALKLAVSQGCPFRGLCLVAAQISVSLSQFLDKLPEWWGLVDSGIEAQRTGLEGKSTLGGNKCWGTEPWCSKLLGYWLYLLGFWHHICVSHNSAISSTLPWRSFMGCKSHPQCILLAWEEPF